MRPLNDLERMMLEMQRLSTTINRLTIGVIIATALMVVLYLKGIG